MCINFSLPVSWAGLGRKLGLGAAALLLTGCQLLPADQEQIQALQELQASQQELQISLQQQIKALQAGQQTRHQLQAGQIQKLQLLLEQHQQESLSLHQQHTFQIEQLGAMLDPTFTHKPATQIVQPDGKLVLGEYEWVHLSAYNLTLPARIDSGARTSSLHAVNLEEFERDGVAWIRFETHYQPETEPEPIKRHIEATLVRTTTIQQASGSEIRPVIRLTLQLGSLVQEAEFTLTDRSNLTFPLLLGRKFFKDIAVIDVGKAYVQGLPEVPVQINLEESRP